MQFSTMTTNLYQECQDLYNKYDLLWKFLHDILGIIKEMEARYINENEEKTRKSDKKCKFYNRGYCKKQTACIFMHPEQICKKHCDDKKCDEGGACRQRHPHVCKFWLKGFCFRGDGCSFLHKKKGEKIDETKDDFNDETEDDNIDDTEDDFIEDTVDEELSAEEIAALYENENESEQLDANVADNLSADEITKLYESETDEVQSTNDDCSAIDDIIKLHDYKMRNKHKRSEVDTCVKRSTRKTLRVGRK